jgi:HSP20 family protein
MADLILWKQKELRQLRAEMDRMVMDFFRDFGASIFDEVHGEMVLADIAEEGESLVITAELPGVEADELEIAASPETLLIGGKSKAFSDTSGGRVKRGSSFSSRIKLPCRIDPDKVEAGFENHRLKIILPKCKSLNFRKIPVRSFGK